MTSRSLLTIVVAASLLSACGTYRDDLHKICNAAELSGNKEAASLADVGPWLEKNVRTRKGKGFLENLGKSGASDWAVEEMKANGITRCPLLDPHIAKPVEIELPETK